MMRLYLAPPLPTRATACISSLECTVASPSARFNATTRLVPERERENYMYIYTYI